MKISFGKVRLDRSAETANQIFRRNTEYGFRFLITEINARIKISTRCQHAINYDFYSTIRWFWHQVTRESSRHNNWYLSWQIIV